MNRKTLFSMCMALILAPVLMAQADADGAPWQFAQAQVPPRRIASPRPAFALPTNGPAQLSTPNLPTPTVPGVLVPVVPSSPAPAASTNEVANIEYNFVALPMKQLLDIYAELVGRTLLRANAGPDSVPDTTTITLNTQSKLTRSEAIIALETIMGMNGVTIVPLGDKFAKVVSEAGVGGAGGLLSTNTNNIPFAGKIITQIVQVKYADLKTLSDTLALFNKTPKSIIAIPDTQTLILRDYAENVARMLEMVNKIDVLTPNSIKPEIIPIRYALASDIASALSALGASGGTSVGKSTSGANFKGGTGTAATGNGISGINGTSGTTGSYPGQPSGAGTGTSGLASSATSGRSAFQQNLQHIVANAAGGSGQFTLFGETKIIADERTNSLLVFANDDDMKMIKLIISKLDVVLAQVLIDAIIMEINLDDTRNLGVSYGTQNGGANGFSGIGGMNNLSSAASSFLNGTSGSSTTTNATTGAVTSTGPSGTGISSTLANLPGGFSYFGKYGNDINVVLEAVAGNSRVNVLSRPRIQTSHAVQADLFIGSTVPYVTSTQNYGYSTGPSANYSQLEVGIHLQVLPLINPDGLVVMDIQADVEQIQSYTQISGNAVPTTSKRQAGAKVAVRDGETIILGGFISDSRSTSISGIPGLMNIPVLGNLFRNTAIVNSRTELVMLMRPTVLPTPEIAAVVASQERNKLAAVKAAEMEIRNDEDKRNLAVDQTLAKDAELDLTELNRVLGFLTAYDSTEVHEALKIIRTYKGPGTDVPRIVAALVPALQHHDPEVVRDVLRTLAIFGDQETIPFIEPLLKAKTMGVRGEARATLKKLRAKPKNSAILMPPINVIPATIGPVTDPAPQKN
jgi:general secretion pathway protein D